VQLRVVRSRNGIPPECVSFPETRSQDRSVPFTKLVVLASALGGLSRVNFGMSPVQDCWILAPACAGPSSALSSDRQRNLLDEVCSRVCGADDGDFITVEMPYASSLARGKRRLHLRPYNATPNFVFCVSFDPVQGFSFFPWNCCPQ